MRKEEEKKRKYGGKEVRQEMRLIPRVLSRERFRKWIRGASSGYSSRLIFLGYSLVILLSCNNWLIRSFRNLLVDYISESTGEFLIIDF